MTTSSEQIAGHLTTISILDQQDDTEKKKASTYKVCISIGGQNWFIFRRYNEFLSLHDKLKKQFPDFGVKIPPKKWFGTVDDKTVKLRRDALHEFVQKLLSHAAIRELPEVRDFLNLEVIQKRAAQQTVDEPNDLEMFEQAEEADESNRMNLGATERKGIRPSDFEFLKVVGKGSFGKVLLARHKKDNTMHAIKVLGKVQIKKRNEVKHVMAERNVLIRNLNHPFLIHLHYSFQTADKLYFVLDYVNGGELFFHLQRDRHFGEARACFYASEMACALGYLHGQNIIYRDLKPENILLDNQGHIVLTDFGLCKEMVNPNDTTSTFCGTPEYLAPEVLRKEPYDRGVDWWTLGAVLYEMLYGLPPFYSRDTKEMYDNILHKPLQLRPTTSVNARSILEGLLQKEKSRRLGCKQDFKEVQAHPFWSFNNINWSLLEKKQIPPPYDPNVKDEYDLKNIDPEFTREAVPQSVAKTTNAQALSASVIEADNTFQGFTYVVPSDEQFEYGVENRM